MRARCGPDAALGAIVGGAAAGFACFSIPGERDNDSDDDDDDWRRGGPPPEDEPPPGVGDGPLDWDQFDRVRARWERVPASSR